VKSRRKSHMGKGESIAAGYWHRREESRHTFVRSWLRTGDKYDRDEDGFFHFHGRTDDLLKVGGQWISPMALEARSWRIAAYHNVRWSERLMAMGFRNPRHSSCCATDSLRRPVTNRGHCPAHGARLGPGLGRSGKFDTGRSGRSFRVWPQMPGEA